MTQKRSQQAAAHGRAEIRRGRGRPSKTHGWCSKVNYGCCRCPRRPIAQVDQDMIFELIDEGRTLEEIAKLLRRDIKHVADYLKALLEQPVYGNNEQLAVPLRAVLDAKPKSPQKRRRAKSKA